MATKRTEKVTPKKSIASSSKKKVVETKRPQTPLDYFRMSESYTSLILGVVVVIITSVLLIAFIRNNTHVEVPQPAKDISTAMKIGPSISPVVSESVTPTTSAIPTTTVAPTKVAQKITPTVTQKPVAKPTTVTQNANGSAKATIYMTKAGDDLWKIAEKFYKSGYNWVDIAKANNITNGNTIYAGMKLTIPNVEKKLATVTVSPTKAPTAMAELNKPATPQVKSYTVKAGDDLWDIAVAVYKDGYRWPEIAKANKLVNPGVIHPGNVLSIP